MAIWHRPALPYAFVGLVALSVSLTWFEPDRFLAGGDITPFIFDGYRDEYLWLWNHAFSGAGSRSFQIALTPLLWFSWGVQALGGSDVLAQRLFLVGMVTATGVSSAYFVAAFSSRRIVIVAAGVLGVFNIVVLVTFPNPLVLTALALMGVLGGTLLRVAEGRRARHWLFAASTVGASVLAFNPPLLAILGIWILLVLGLALAMSAYEGLVRASHFLMRAGPLVVLLNLWWLVPTVMTLFGPEGSVVIAQSDVVSWSWTHSRSSVSNVLTGTSAWGLAHGEYFPYASELESPPWGLLRFGLPHVALAAPLLTSGRRRRFSLVLVAAALCCVFLGKGLHPPWAGANLWLYEHVPGFWLFREPATKMGLVQLTAFIALMALTLSAVLDLRRAAKGASRMFLTAGSVLVIVAVAAFPHPLWTGRVTADDPPRRSLHVALPDAWRDTARFINRSSLGGKVLVLPLDDFYQMPTTWGYYGSDELARSMLSVPVLRRTGEGYMGDLPGVQDQIDRVEQALLANDLGVVSRLLKSLGVSHVLLRRDLDTSFPNRSFTNPDRLGAPLSRVPGIRLARTFGPLSVYTTNSWESPVRTYSSLIESVHQEDESVVPLVGAAEPYEAISGDVEGADGVAVQIDDGAPTVPFKLPEPGSYLISRRGMTAPTFMVRRNDTSSGSVLELRATDEVVVDGVPLKVSPVTVPLPTADVSAIRIGGMVRPLSDDGTLMAIPPSVPLVAFGPGAAETALDQFGPVGDCHREDGATAEESGLRAEPLSGQPQPAFRLEASRHSACIWAELVPVAADGVYRVSFEYRSLAGSPPRFCLWQEPAKRCSDLPGLSNNSEWTSYNGVFAPAAGATSLALYLYADAPATSGITRNEYRSVKVTALRPVLVETLDLPATAVSELALSAGDHVLSHAEDRQPSPTLGPISQLGDCNKHDPRTPAEAGLSVRTSPEPSGVIELRARAHSSCVWATLDDFRPASSYRLRLDYRTLRGAPARICVWQEGPGGCARTPQLKRSKQWRHLDATVTPAEGTVGLRLFLYADGPATGETVVEFRGPSLVPTSPSPVVFVKSAARSAEPPAVSSRSDGPARYDIQLGRATAPFVIGLPESYSPGWKLEGFPPGTSVEHIMLDGYANGWRVRGVLPEGPIHLVAKYQPAFVARKALTVSTVAAMGLALALLGSTIGRRVPRLRRLLRPGSGQDGSGFTSGAWRGEDPAGARRSQYPVPVVPAVPSTESVPSDRGGVAPARLFLGLLLAIVGVTIAVVGVPATTVLAVSALGVVLLAPPWRWLFGAGLATMAVGAAASGFGAEQASGALVVASAIALAFSVLLAAAQAATGWRRVVPLAVRRTSMTGTLPDMPLLELSRSAGSAIRSLTPFAPGGRTELVTTDKRLSSLAKVVETLDVETILDVGCEGGTPMHLARNRLYGLHRFDVCPDNAYMATWYRSAEASRGIPYDDSTFDCVILGDVIEHVPDPDSLLADVRRVLRPGGLLVVSTPNVVFWANRMLVPLGVHRRFTETSTDTNIGRARFTTFSHKSLDRLLQQTGYEVLRRKGAPSLFRFPLSLADRALSHFPSVASRLLYVARRDDD